MWFKMSQKIIDCPVSIDLGKSFYSGDQKMFERILAFVRILCKTADGAACMMRDSTDFSHIVGINGKQSSIIWDILLKHNVLRANPDGTFSCAEWMRECGILGERKKKEEAMKTSRSNAESIANAFASQFAGSRTSF